MSGREFLALDSGSMRNYLEGPRKINHATFWKTLGLTGVQRERRGRKIWKKWPRIIVRGYTRANKFNLPRYEAIIQSAEKIVTIDFNFTDISKDVINIYVMEIIIDGAE